MPSNKSPNEQPFRSVALQTIIAQGGCTSCFKEFEEGEEVIEFTNDEAPGLTVKICKTCIEKLIKEEPSLQDKIKDFKSN
jgi:hypothetical protein